METIKKTIRIEFFAVLFMFLGAMTANADGVLSGLDYSVQIQGDMQLTLGPEASVFVTLADGTASIVSNQDQIPSNLSGAVVDVFSGCATASGSNTVEICIGDQDGKAKAITGAANLTTKEGVDVLLDEGKEYPLVGDSPIAPATAASGDNLGGPAGDFAPFDSTNNDDRNNPQSGSQA